MRPKACTGQSYPVKYKPLNFHIFKKPAFKKKLIAVGRSTAQTITKSRYRCLITRHLLKQEVSSFKRM